MADRNGTFQDESENQTPGQSVHKPENEAPDSWRKFCVLQAGRTNGAHESVVKTFESSGQTQVETSKDADYCLLFCPVSTRVGTDVGYAMKLLDDGKEAVLVVMHHTFNPDQVIPPSRRLVDDRRVRLTLDCLFYQDKLLRCEFNDKMKANIKKFFRSSILEFSQQTDPSGQTAPGQNVEAERGRDSGRKSKRGSRWFSSNTAPASHPPETSGQGFLSRIFNISGGTETHVNKRESQTDNPKCESRSDPGSVPPNRSGSLDHLGAPPPQSESGTNESSKTEAPNRPEQDDLPTDIINAIKTMREEMEKMKQQHQDVVELKRENVKRKEEIEKLRKEVVELKQHLGRLVDSQSNTGSGPPGGPGESGSQDHQVTGPLQSEHVSDDISNMEQIESNWKRERESVRQAKRRKLSGQNSQTGSGPAEPGSGGDPGPSDQQDAPPPRPEDGTQSRASWRKFFVLTGQTHGPCHSVVEIFKKSLGQTEVDSPEDADYCLILCPMSAQVKKNIMEVMERLPNGKEAVLVVMHHTSKPEEKIPPSSRLVDELRVPLTLDCLFYWNRLLDCEFNDKMKADIKKFFRSSKSKSMKKYIEATEMEKRSKSYSGVAGDKKRGKEPEQLEDQTGPSVKSESRDGPGPADIGFDPASIDQQRMKQASWRKFCVILMGQAYGPRDSIVEIFESLGQTEVKSPEDADYCLILCIIIVPAEKDIKEAVKRLPDGKEAVLVVMHRTFNPQREIPPSSRLVHKRRVPLTLDCLFYQDKLLKCKFNDKMKADIQKFFRSSKPKIP